MTTAGLLDFGPAPSGASRNDAVFLPTLSHSVLGFMQSCDYKRPAIGLKFQTAE
jgi:hypothetical protein